MARTHPSDWQPAGIEMLEPAAQNAIRHPTSSYIVAGPGAGKTEFLAQRADFLFATGICPTPRNILAISFKRDAARNLRERVSQRTPSCAHRFESLTFDAFTKGLIDRFQDAIPQSWRLRGDYIIEHPRPQDINAHLNEVAAQHPNLAAEITAIPRDTFITEILGSLQLPRQPTPPQTATEASVLAWWQRRYTTTNPHRVNFVMLNRLAELVVRANPAISKALRLTYPFIFIDEFQDTTYAQYSFLRSVFGTSDCTVTAVGDDKQRIMGWAGALDDAFAEFCVNFGATRFELEWNFRSSPEITQIHHVVASTLNPRATSAISKVAPSITGRSGETWRFDSAADEARHIADWIRTDCDSSGRAPDRYALLARQKTSELQPMLEQALATHGIPFRNDDELVGSLRLQDLLADDLARCILDIIRLAAANGGNPAAWIRVTDIVSRLYDQPDDSSIYPQSLRRFEQFLARSRNWLHANPPTTGAIDTLVNAIVAHLGVSAIQSAFPAHGRRGFLDETTDALKARLSSVITLPSKWRDVCDQAEGLGAIPLMTIHKSKGLEYHTVIFIGLDDEQWWSFGRDPDEALRTFFVGLSRAEQRTIFTYCRDRGDRDKIGQLYDLLASANVVEVEL